MNTRIYINALGCILNVVSYGLAKELFVRQPQYAQLGCLLERKGERGYGNLEQHGHYSPMTGGPPLPEKKKKKKSHFQYPAHTDTELLQTRHCTTKVRSQVAAIRGGTASFSKTPSYTWTRHITQQRCPILKRDTGHGISFLFFYQCTFSYINYTVL